MFTNVDVRGVSRGPCTRDKCGCDGFTRPCTEPSAGTSGVVQCGWCCYCGHSPVSHTRIERDMYSPGQIVSVSWHGAQPPPLELAACRDWNSVMEAGQPKKPDVIVLDADEETPESGTAEGTASQEQPEHMLEPKKRNSDEGTSSMDTSTLGESDLLQNIENLKKENKELKHENSNLRKHLREEQNLSSNLKYENSSLKKRLHEEQTLSQTLSTSLELVDKLKQLLPQEASISESPANQSVPETPKKDPVESVEKRPRRHRNIKLAGTSLVKIGPGVTVEKEKLDEIMKMRDMNATKFARQLFRTIFTPEEMEGKCLGGATRRNNKEPLDPIRVNAIVDYTCMKFGADKQYLRTNLSSFLFHQNTGTRAPSHH